MKYGKRTKGETQIFENVVSAIIDKTSFEIVKKKREKSSQINKAFVDSLIEPAILQSKLSEIESNFEL